MSLRVAAMGTVLLLAGESACHTRMGGKGGAVVIQLDSQSAGKEVKAVVGERLEVVLPETGSTGYRWRVAAACSELLKTEVDESRPGSSQPGAPGEHRWVFVAQAAGICALRFESARSWEIGATGKVVGFPVTIAAAP